MDKKFLEFWGNFMLSMARGQEQMETMAEWMKQGISSLEEMAQVFRRIYGLEPETEGFGHPAFFAAMRQWGWVPLSEFQKLEARCRELETTVSDQQRSLSDLRALLDESGRGQEELFLRFQRLMSAQGDQFTKLMEQLGETLATTVESAQTGSEAQGKEEPQGDKPSGA